MEFNKKKKMPPESLLYTGELKQTTKIKHFQYNEDQLQKHVSHQELDSTMVDWFVVEGLQDVNTIDTFCSRYHVDPLVVEDILNVHQRNKIEQYNDYIFSVQRFNYVADGIIKYDYISMLLFNDKLITFSEQNNKFVTDILTRLESKESIIRHQKHKYLFYVICDMVVDEKYAVFYDLESKINDLENNLLDLDSRDEVQLYNIRKELLFIRNSASQLYDNLFTNKEITKVLQDPSSKKYYADLKDHILNLKEKTIFEIDVINNLYEMHINNLSRRMNSIMTTLTIFSAIFIPLSFVAGVFGMNFINFPILKNQYGMLFFLGICLIVPAIMVIFFKKKKWF